MKLHVQSDNGFTLIKNKFIDQYMPAANGEFVKLYLYLLRCAGRGQEVSVSSIADFFNHTEKDVRRALAYWEKLRLLTILRDESNNITDILFSGGSDMSAQEVSEFSEGSETSEVSDASGNTVSSALGDSSEMPAASGSSHAPAVPSRSSLSKERRQELRSQDEIRRIFFVAEQYLERPLTATEMDVLMYLYDILDFSQDLTEYLLEYCASKGNPGVRYMEKVAQGWYKDGITTPAQARLQTTEYQKDYKSVLQAMGISGRSPVPKECGYVDKWKNLYMFSMEIITEACSRAVLQTGRGSFEYIDRILSNWHKSGVRTMEDIARQDELHAIQQENAPAHPLRSSRRSGITGRAGKETSGRTSSNKFTRISQRENDWKQLEDKLIRSNPRKGD